MHAMRHAASAHMPVTPSGPKKIGSAPYWSALTCVTGCAFGVL